MCPSPSKVIHGSHVIERAANRAAFPFSTGLARVAIPVAAGDDISITIPIDIRTRNKDSLTRAVGIDHMPLPMAELKRLIVQPDIDARRFPVIRFAQNIHASITGQITDPRLVIAHSSSNLCLQ
jgi:hypothetical protein